MNDIKNMIWQEKWRPVTIDQFCLQPQVKDYLEQWSREKHIPHLILHGDYGVGKTSIVKFLIKELDCEVLEINASKTRGIDLMRDTVTDFVSRNTLQSMKIVVFHEGEKLTKDAQDSLKEDIENSSDDTRFIFTTNQVERISDAIQDRCLVVKVFPDTMQAVGKYVYNILESEKITVSDDQKKQLWNLIQLQYPSIRRIIKNVQNAVKDGELAIGSLTDYDEYNKILNLLKTSSNTNYIDNWHAIRSIVSGITLTELDNIFSFVEEHATDIFKKEDVLEAVVTIAEYGYKSAFVIDKELNVAALFAKLLEIKNA